MTANLKRFFLVAVVVLFAIAAVLYFLNGGEHEGKTASQSPGDGGLLSAGDNGLLSSHPAHSVLGERNGRQNTEDVWNSPRKDDDLTGLTLNFAEGNYVNQELIKALSLTSDEILQINTSISSAFETLRPLEVAHMEVVWEKEGESAAVIQPFPEEAADLREDFHRELLEILGSERKARFEVICRSFLTALMGDFGREQRVLHVVRYPPTPDTEQYTFRDEDVFGVQVHALRKDAFLNEPLDFGDPEMLTKIRHRLARYGESKSFYASDGLPWAFRHLLEGHDSMPVLNNTLPK